MLLSDTTLRVGSTAATRAYLGSTLVWEPGGGGDPTPPPTVTVYTQDFSSGTGNWQAQAGSSATDVVRDTARYAGGALRWTAGTGYATVENMQGIAILPGQVLTMTAKVSHSAATPMEFIIGAIAFAPDFSSQTNFGTTISVPAGTTATTLTYSYTIPSNRGLLGITMAMNNPAPGDQAWMDSFTITRPE